MRWITVLLFLAQMAQPGLPPAFASTDTLTRTDFFRIHVVDRRTARGVPLVELKTTNNIRCYTDSSGICAFYEPGLMNTDVFFFIESHGYQHPADGFGMRGVRLRTTPGATATVTIDRTNIAQRLYRVTGQGIYRDSILTGHPVPTKQPLLNAQVTGQDSVYTCIYNGRLFWMWGDTGKPAYPLGHFGMAGAFSSLPEDGGLDPDLGVDLEYYTDSTGFSRPMCPMKDPGMYWLDGLLTTKDPDGKARMVAACSRMKSLSETYERGLVLFDDDTESFRWLVRSEPDFLPYHNSGHAFGVRVGTDVYHYFATQFPLAARMRVKDDWVSIIDVNRYEIFTALNSDRPRWISVRQLLDKTNLSLSALIEKLEKEKQRETTLYDIETGDKVIPHGGTICFNPYRNRWIMITVQHFGKSSLLGEVWYAQADTPLGPWSCARKIATHNKYSFYNPVQHPCFDKDGGRTIYFEGTYSHTFSGSPETATPRYDYNQIMYRLDLDDERLLLPVAVYRTPDGYKLRQDLRKDNAWDTIENTAFFAMEPDRPHAGLTPVYQTTGRLTTTAPAPSAAPLFFALPPDAPHADNPAIVPLFEFRNPKADRYSYSTDPAAKDSLVRNPKPLCSVWKTPPAALIDLDAAPYRPQIHSAP
jgi:hypothetical protein